MKNLISIFWVSFLLTACGTNMKIQTSGSLHPKKEEAPLLLQYKFHALTDAHEVFLLDENMHRYNVKVPANVDTSKGIVIYLPANKKYVLSSILNTRVNGHVEYQFGKNLTLFELKPKYLNRIPYFEFTGQSRKDNRFGLRAENAETVEIHKRVARANFQTELPIRTIKIEEFYPQQ